MPDILFDVDNTLYPIAIHMEQWYHQNAVEYATKHLGLSPDGLADKLEQYYQEHGAVITGLLRNHPNASAYDFYKFKGRVPVSMIPVDQRGINAVKASPHRHVALTNASREHAVHVIEHLGLSDKFEAIFGLDDVGFYAKPSKENTRRIIALANLNPKDTVFVEDSLRNLAYPKQLGMKTVLIGSRYADYGSAPEYVDAHVPDLATAMEYINAL